MLTVEDSQTPAATTIRARNIEDGILGWNEIVTDGIEATDGNRVSVIATPFIFFSSKDR